MGGENNDQGVEELYKALMLPEAAGSQLSQIDLTWNRIWLDAREKLASLQHPRPGGNPQRFICVDRGLPPPLGRKMGSWDFVAGKPNDDSC